MISVLKIINKYFKGQACRVLIAHSELVAAKALAIAHTVPELKPDLAFIREASMLHDIGICLVDAPELDCHGKEPYVKHGVLGRELLDKEGLPKHGLVCERHTGVGITKEEIIKNKLPLPHRDLVPVSVEEEIISLADLFYSKSSPHEFSVNEIIERQQKFGEDKIIKLKGWLKKYHFFL
ncbi:MAG: HDIG domain-containing metalloprotein [Candidatus Nanoarchaeia archaeon]|jgi:uncharacterized protein